SRWIEGAEEWRVESPGLFRADAGHHLDACGLQYLGSTPGLGVRIGGGEHDPPNPSGQDQVDAGGSLSVVAAWFQGHVERRAAGSLARGANGLYLRVRLAILPVPALA